jgi:hypothetical protein
VLLLWLPNCCCCWTVAYRAGRASHECFQMLFTLMHLCVAALAAPRVVPNLANLSPTDTHGEAARRYVSIPLQRHPADHRNQTYMHTTLHQVDTAYRKRRQPPHVPAVCTVTHGHKRRALGALSRLATTIEIAARLVAKHPIPLLQDVGGGHLHQVWYASTPKQGLLCRYWLRFVAHGHLGMAGCI